MKIKFRIGDMPEVIESRWDSGTTMTADDSAMLCLIDYYHGRKWPTTGPNEWVTTVHLSTGESVRIRAQMRPQLSVDRHVPSEAES